MKGRNTLIEDPRLIRLCAERLRRIPLLGHSDVMVRLRRQISMEAVSDQPLLLTGEKGTGKDLVARHIYLQSRWFGYPFLILRAGHPMVESFEQLARRWREEIATTLSVPEMAQETVKRIFCYYEGMGDLSPKEQESFLRSLQSDLWDRHGCHVRWIFGATISNPEEEDELRFAPGFLQVTAGHRYHILPLRARGADIAELIKHHLENYQGPIVDETKPEEIVSQLLEYEWQGNVGELFNWLDALCFLQAGRIITNKSLADSLARLVARRRVTGEQMLEDLLTNKDHYESVRQFAKMHVEYHLQKNCNDFSKTAQEIGIERTYFYRKARQLKLR